MDGKHISCCVANILKTAFSQFPRATGLETTTTDTRHSMRRSKYFSVSFMKEIPLTLMTTCQIIRCHGGDLFCSPVCNLTAPSTFYDSLVMVWLPIAPPTAKTCTIYPLQPLHGNEFNSLFSLCIKKDVSLHSNPHRHTLAPTSLKANHSILQNSLRLSGGSRPAPAVRLCPYNVPPRGRLCLSVDLALLNPFVELHMARLHNKQQRNVLQQHQHGSLLCTCDTQRNFPRRQVTGGVCIYRDKRGLEQPGTVNRPSEFAWLAE